MINVIRITEDLNVFAPEVLECPKEEFHVTLQFHPEGEDADLGAYKGMPVKLIINGWGCDGKNAGFRVKLPPAVRGLFNNDCKVPHITTSTAVGAPPAGTGYLQFEPTTPYEIWGIIDQIPG